MMSGVGVVGVVGVGGGGGGGNNFYTWAPSEPMYGVKNFKSKTLISVLFISKVHVWFKCPCMVGSRRKKGRGGGVPLHSEIIVRKKEVSLKYPYWTTYPLLSHYDFRMKRDSPSSSSFFTSSFCCCWGIT